MHVLQNVRRDAWIIAVPYQHQPFNCSLNIIAVVAKHGHRARVSSCWSEGDNPSKFRRRRPAVAAVDATPAPKLNSLHISVRDSLLKDDERKFGVRAVPRQARAALDLMRPSIIGGSVATIRHLDRKVRLAKHQPLFNDLACTIASNSFAVQGTVHQLMRVHSVTETHCSKHRPSAAACPQRCGKARLASFVCSPVTVAPATADLCLSSQTTGWQIHINNHTVQTMLTKCCSMCMRPTTREQQTG